MQISEIPTPHLSSYQPHDILSFNFKTLLLDSNFYNNIKYNEVRNHQPFYTLYIVNDKLDILKTVKKDIDFETIFKSYEICKSLNYLKNYLGKEWYQEQLEFVKQHNELMPMLVAYQAKIELNEYDKFLVAINQRRDETFLRYLKNNHLFFAD